MSRKVKPRANCRADTRGGSCAGIPKCLIDSAAYRDLSLHARAILIELTARMSGWNDGESGVSQRELGEATGCRRAARHRRPGRADGARHPDVGAEGKWKERQARQYRVTSVTTDGAGATNDYLQWTPLGSKSGIVASVAGGVNLLPSR